MNLLLDDFYEWNPEIVRKMQITNHHSIKYNFISSHHGEGSVFAHTLLVLKEAEKYNCINYEVAALCHDIGKIYTRTFNPNNKKIVFYGHDVYSLEATISFCNFLNEKHGEGFCDLPIVFSLVGNHMKKDVNTKNLKFLTPHLRDNLNFQKCDNIGRICDDKKSSKIDELLKLPEKNKHYFDPNFVIVSGIPGSGKDTWAKENGYKVFSYDNIRLEIANTTDYNKAWNYCNEHNINLNQHLIEEIKNYYKENPCFDLPIAICNTNVTSSARRKIKNVIKSLYKDTIIHNEYIWVSKKTAIQRDLNRKDKTVGKDVINHFYGKQSLPSNFEDFNSFHITFND